MLAVSSLPAYASSADIFISVAPPAEYQHNARRGWCRAEVLAKVCSGGLRNFFSFAGEGPLVPVTEEQLPSLPMYVFEGETSFDKEALVEPMLGLYALALRQVRAGVNLQHMQPVLKLINDNKERFFPRVHHVTQENGVTPEVRELFGPLVESTEKFVNELSLAECAVSLQSS
jgi:hypothetical protein